jgi:hypothetical protein
MVVFEHDGGNSGTRPAGAIVVADVVGHPHWSDEFVRAASSGAIDPPMDEAVVESSPGSRPSLSLESRGGPHECAAAEGLIQLRSLSPAGWAEGFMRVLTTARR